MRRKRNPSRISPRFKQLKCFRYKNQSNELSKYVKRMSSPTGVIKDRVMEKMLAHQGYTFDDQNAARSVYDPEALYDALRRYDKPSIFQPEKDILHKAYSRLLARYSEHFGTLSPMTLKEVKWYTRGTASAGAPHFISKDKVFVDLSSNMKDAFAEPCVAYYRTSSRLKKEGFKKSTRLVWGYPYEATLVEGSFARPLIGLFKSINSDYAIGHKKRQMGAELSKFSWCNFVGTFDWSCFDSTIPRELINLCFNFLKRFFKNVDEYLWKKMQAYFIYTPILMPNGKVYVGKERGIPSGSYFTNIIGSLVNIVLMEYLSIKHEFYIQHMLVHGDDSIVGVSDELPVEEMGRSASNDFGMVMHPDKQRYTSKDHDLEFLSHSWVGGRPYRDVTVTAQQLIFAERGLSKGTDIREVRIQRLMGLYGDNYKAWPLILELLRLKGLYRSDGFATHWAHPKQLMYDPDFMPPGGFRTGLLCVT